MLMTPLSRVDISPELEKLAVEVARHIKAEQDLPPDYPHLFIFYNQSVVMI
jgi:hypothetical protein